MPEGIQVYNDNNTLTIDGTFKNYALVSKGTIGNLERRTTGTPYYGINHTSVQRYQGLFTGYLNGNLTNPLIGVTLNKVHYVTVFGIVKLADGRWRFDIYVGAGVNKKLENPPSLDLNLEYFVFDEPRFATTSGSYGLQVWDDAGSLVFDSNLKYMRVHSLVPQSVYANGGSFPEQITNIPIPTGRKIAHVTSCRSGDMELGFFVDDDWGSRLYQDSEIFAINQISSSNTLAVYSDEWIESYSGGGSGMPYRSYKFRNYGALLIDVTGF